MTVTTDRFLQMSLWMLIGSVVASWYFILSGAGMGLDMLALSSMHFPVLAGAGDIPAPWSVGSAITMFFMWWIMMIAMMFPALLPGIRKSSVRNNRRCQRKNLANPSSLLFFSCGYILPWLFFSLAVTFLQYGLEIVRLVHPKMLWIVDPDLSAILLITTGIFQLSTYKKRNLQQWRSDFTWDSAFFDGHHRGFHCVQGSGPLMVLLFVGGVMNLYWIGALTFINFLERNLTNPLMFSKGVGCCCVCAGLYILAHSGLTAS